jgi:drug/metabolite transporter (DMT)-like permease
MSPRRIKAYLILLFVVVIWGIAGPVIKYTLGGIDPLPFLVYRLAISSAVSVVFFARKIKRGKKFHHLRAHFPLALLYGTLAVTLGLGSLFFALKDTTVLDLTLITVLDPLLALAGGAYFFRDHITKKEKIGISVVLLGVALNSFYPFFTGGSTIRFTGNILLFVYILSDSSSILIAKRSLRSKIKSANLTNLAFIIGLVTLFPIVISMYGAQNLWGIITNLPFKYHLGVWYMALISGNLAYYLYVRGERTLEVSEAVLFNYLQPVITIPLAIFWLKETLSIHYLLGAAIIAMGLLIVEYKKYKPNTTK